VDDSHTTQRRYFPNSSAPASRHTREFRKVRALVSGAEALEHPYNDNVLWLPQSVTVAYERVDDGPWRASDPSVYGYLVKRDGTAGQRDFTHRYWRSHKRPELPEWARQFVADNMPDREGPNYCVGDPDPTHFGEESPDPECFAQCAPDGYCTWKPGHSGQHVAGDGARIVGVSNG